jgi:hypothetical protein
MSLAHDTKTTTTKRKEVINWLPEMQLTSPTDTISESIWVASDGLTTSAPTNTNSTATVWIDDGRLGAYCRLTNYVVTASGAEYDKTIIMEIVPT